MSRLDILIQGVPLSQLLIYVEVLAKIYSGTTTINQCFNIDGVYFVKPEIINCLN